MAQDSFDININGVNTANQSSKIDTSSIQKAIDQVASDLKKLDTSNFQKSLRDLAQNIQKSAIAASNFVANMQKIEAKLSLSLQQGLFSEINKSNISNQDNSTQKSDVKRPVPGLDTNNTEKFTKSIGSLSDSIEKLALGVKEGFRKNEESVQEKPEEKKEGFISDVKKLLAAVGIGSVIKQISENEILAPARATGMLINSNVISNPRQAGNELLSSFETRVANNTGIISGGVGAGIGGTLGSIIPGVGTLIGAGLGYAAGSSIGHSIGQTKMVTELPTLQRSLTTDYYSSLSRQLPQYNQFAQTQYGQKGFGAIEAFQDPYFESKAELGKNFSRFSGGNLTPEVTTNILKSLTAQGASGPQELSLTGNLLGQIARFTGKTSLDIEKVYKSVEKSGMNPNEGLQKTLSLLQSGLSIREAENVLQKTSQRTEAFGAGQQAYFAATPFQQFTAQLVGKSVGVDVEKLEQGDKTESRKYSVLIREADQERAAGRLGPSSLKVQQLMQAGIGREMADIGNIDIAAKGKVGEEYIKPSLTAEKTIEIQQEAINKGAKGRGPTEIIDKALEEIGKSTDSFVGLKDAAKSLTDSFKEAADSFAGYVTHHSPLKGLWDNTSTKKPLSQTAGGR